MRKENDRNDRNDRNGRKDRNDLKILKIPEELRLVRLQKLVFGRKKKSNRGPIGLNQWHCKLPCAFPIQTLTILFFKPRIPYLHEVDRSANNVIIALPFILDMIGLAELNSNGIRSKGG